MNDKYAFQVQSFVSLPRQYPTVNVLTSYILPQALSLSHTVYVVENFAISLRHFAVCFFDLCVIFCVCVSIFLGFGWGGGGGGGE